jgi:hypothetical protein
MSLLHSFTHSLSSIDGAASSRSTFCRFFARVATLGPSYSAMVLGLLKNFEQFESAMFAGSGLQPILQSLLR